MKFKKFTAIIVSFLSNKKNLVDGTSFKVFAVEESFLFGVLNFNIKLKQAFFICGVKQNRIRDL